MTSVGRGFAEIAAKILASRRARSDSINMQAKNDFSTGRNYMPVKIYITPHGNYFLQIWPRKLTSIRPQTWLIYISSIYMLVTRPNNDGSLNLGHTSSNVLVKQNTPVSNYIFIIFQRFLGKMTFIFGFRTFKLIDIVVPFHFCTLLYGWHRCQCLDLRILVTRG